MVRLYLGLSGSGKTKEMIHAINAASEESDGSVVCIEMGNKLRYDINFRVRLISYREYGLKGTYALKAFISGLHAGNFDITHIFLKSIHRLLGTDEAEAFADFCDWCAQFGEDNSISFAMTATSDPATAPERLRKYM